MIEERKIIEDFFAKRETPGRFLELGANDGVTDSLTGGLVAAGWSGVQVEADAATFLRLAATQRGNERIELVNAAVGPGPGLCRFYSQDKIGGDGSGGCQESTLSDRHKAGSENKGNTYHRPHWVNLLTVRELIEVFGGPLGWDFLLIDVEGISGDVLKTFPLADMADTLMVCVEADTYPSIIREILAPWYVARRAGVCNVIGVRK